MRAVELNVTVNTGITYPCLMQVNAGEMGQESIYFFWEEACGTCLLGVDGDKTGEQGTNYNMKHFHFYNGAIQLSNN